MKLASAALRGEVRVRDCSLDFWGDMRVAKLPYRFVGAARLGEVRIAGCDEFAQRRCILYIWWSWGKKAGLPSFFGYKEGFKEIDSGFGTILFVFIYIEVSEESMFGYGEGAPVHIGEVVARRCGPTIVIELLWHFGVVYQLRSRRLRRDREWTDSRQLSQPRWRRARAGFLWRSSWAEVSLLDALFAESCFIVATADIGATEVCQFQEDRVKQARCNFLVQHIAFHASFEVISGVCSSNSIRSRFDCWEFSKI